MEAALNIEQIWSEYRAGLRAFLLSKVANSADVEDLLQEILIKAHTKLETLKSEARLRPWLYRIARNAISDYYRRDKSKRPVNPDDLWYATVEDEPLPELARCLEPFINALPLEHSALLRAIDLDGTSQKAQAETLGIRYSTLKSRVKSARTQLRAVFESCCEFSLDSRGAVVGYEIKSEHCGNC